jgi:uncharacterized protein DUF4038/collagenase-like protein with putative collagen-binding domain
MKRHSPPVSRPAAASLVVLLLLGASLGLGFEPPPLKVSVDGRSLVTADGDPFFWLGDTAWSIFDQSVKHDAADQPAIDLYLRTRKEQGFNVIQTHFLTNRVRGPIEQANAYGHEPFIEGDFTRPRTIPGADNDYWDYADYLVERAAHHGFHLAVVAAWSNSLRSDSHPFIARPEVAYGYGFFLGNRYRQHSHIIWLLGGDAFGAPDDRANLSDARRAMTRALAEGIADGVNGVRDFDGRADYSTTLMSYHPPGGGVSSSKFFHHEEWLDINMIQTTSRLRFINFETVAADYAKTPAKPTLDCEVAYEYSLPLNAGDRKRFPGQRVSAWEVRRAAYWNVFSGGFGHTYGHRNLIGWVRTGEAPLKWGADRPWNESLGAPGARQIGWLRWLVESRPMPGRVPDQSLLEGEQVRDENYASATRGPERRYAFVYLPTGKAISVRLQAMSGDEVVAWWYNPRDGSARRAGDYGTAGARKFTPPSSGPGADWVLVLDDTKAGFPAPGRRP